MTSKVSNPNPYYCFADVHDTFGAGFSQCGNKRKKDSEFCGTHSPEAKARREAKSKTYWESESERWNAPARELDRLRAVNAKLLAALEAVVAAVAPTTLGTNELSMIFRKARDAIKEANK